MKRAIFPFTVMAVMMVFSLSLAAQPFMGGRMGERGERGERGMMMGPSPLGIYTILKAKQKDFKISDSQLEQIKNNAFALEEKLIPLENKSKLHLLELEKQMMMEKKDYKKISEALAKVSADRNAIFIERLKAKDAIANILTQEQRDAIKDAMRSRFKDRMPFRKEGRGMMMRRGDFHREGDAPSFPVDENKN